MKHAKAIQRSNWSNLNLEGHLQLQKIYQYSRVPGPWTTSSGEVVGIPTSLRFILLEPAAKRPQRQINFAAEQWLYLSMNIQKCTNITYICIYNSYIYSYIYIYIRIQIRGRSCAEAFGRYKTQCIRCAAFGRYKTQCIRCATTKFSAWYLFCSYNIQNTTFSDSENNSKSALQNPMHLKLKDS